MRVTVDVNIDDPVVLAAAFADMNDEKQAQFFIELARLTKEWAPISRAMQMHSVGRHLRDCGCSTIEARDLVNDIALGMQP